jgi:hypothetical protein
MTTKINRLKQADLVKSKPGLLCDGGGLWFRTTAAKGGGLNRSWIYKYTTDKVVTATRKSDGSTYQRQKEAQIGLGPFPLVGADAARAAARELDRKRRSGQDRDPAATRRQQKAERRTEKAEDAAAKKVEANKAPIFDRCIDGYWDAVRSKWTSERHAQQYKDSLVKYVSPIIGAKPVTEVTIEDILGCLRPIWREKAETASRLRARIEAVLNYAYSHLHPNDPLAAQRLIDANPARRSSHLVSWAITIAAPRRFRPCRFHRLPALSPNSAPMAALLPLRPNFCF